MQLPSGNCTGSVEVVSQLARDVGDMNLISELKSELKSILWIFQFFVSCCS